MQEGQYEVTVPTVRDLVAQQAGQAGVWTEDWSHDQGLHRLLGTIRYPKAA